jgi:hypothetical protein
MQQMLPWLIFCVLFLAFCIWKPLAARMFIGLFFIVMAIAVNWVLSLTAPQLFVGLGADAPLLPFYEWVFTDVVARAPQAVGILAGIGEIVVGLLMLSKGRWALVGLVGGIVFLLLITPLGVWTLPNPIMAFGLGYLATKPLDRSFADIVRGLVGRMKRRGRTASGTSAEPGGDVD